MKLPRTNAEATPLGEAEAAGIFAPLTGQTLLLAVSGGPDSIAMMGMAALWRTLAGGGARLYAATIDHGLRAQSRAEAEAVGLFAAHLGIDHDILDWTGPKPATGIQEAARAARYRLLVERAQALGACLLTAHTADDQAETILLRLACGSGPAGLTGMKPERLRDGIRHIRPLLGIAKARLVPTCAARGWPFVTDPSNADPRFARARVRRIMPVLAAEGLSQERLVRLGKRLDKLEDLVASRLDDAWARALVTLGPALAAFDLARLRGEPLIVIERLLQRTLDHLHPGAPQRLERIESCAEELMLAQAGGVAFRRSLGQAVVSLDRSAHLKIVPAPPRRRGRSAAERPGTP